MRKNEFLDRKIGRGYNLHIYILLITLILFSTTAFAIPNTLTLQGKLTNLAGTAQVGTYNFSFKIYDAYTEGNKLWEQNVNLTTDANGIYDVILGSLSSLNFSQNYFLGITIGTDNETQPRINLTSMPYTFRANTSEALNPENIYRVNTLNITGNLSVGTDADDIIAITSGNVNLSSSGNLNLIGNLSLANKITFSLGQIIDNLVNGFLRITGSLNVTSNLIALGNVSLGSTGNETLTIVTNKFNVSSGNLDISGGLRAGGGINATGDLKVNNLINLTAATGDLDIAGGIEATGGLNVSGDLSANKKLNITAATGNLATAGTISADGVISSQGQALQQEVNAFKISNYSTEYSSTGFKIANFTSAYDTRTERWGRENTTDYLGGTGANNSLIRASNMTGWVRVEDQYELSNFTSNYDNRADRYGKSNYSDEYANTGYKKANFTSDYDARTDRYNRTNFTVDYDARSDRFSNENFTTRYDTRTDRFGLTNFSATPLFVINGNVSIIGNLSVSSNMSVDSNTLFVDAENNRVGIGTTSPQDNLEVIGSVRVSGSLNATSINATRLNINNTLFVNGSRVGIGTTGPGYRLEISSSGQDVTDFAIKSSWAQPLIYFYRYTNSGELSLGTSGADQVRISAGRSSYLNAGNVGIGTSTPDNLLTVVGNEITSNAILHLNASDNYNKSVINVITLDHVLKSPVNSTGGVGLSILFRATDNSSQLYNIGNISAILYNATNGSQLGAITFSTVSSDTGDGSFGHLQERLRIDGTGRVGINTTTPTKTLHVVGDANISGRLDVGKLNITGVTFSQGDIDAAGSLRVSGGANVSGDLGVSGGVNITNNLDVRGSSITLGDATSDTLNVNAYIGTNLIPIDNTRNLGSASNFWRTAYVDILIANNLSVTSTNLSGTSLPSFTINANYSGNDDRDVNLIFERGTPITNAVLKWDSTNKRFDMNFPLNIQTNMNLSVDDTTLFVDGSVNRVGIGTNTPSHTLTVVGDINVTGGAYIAALNLTGNVNLGNTVNITSSTGDISLSGNILVGGYANISGDLNVNDNFNVTGSSGNVVTAGNLTVNGEMIYLSSENSSLYQPVYGSDDGLVLYLPFNAPNGSIQYDRSPYGNDGTLQGGINCNGSLGKYGTACGFNGNDSYVDASNIINFSVSNRLTFEAWFIIKGNGSSDSTNENTIINIKDVYDYHKLYWKTTTSKASCQIDFINPNSGTSVNSNTILSYNTWYHLACTYDGANVILYLDGVQDSIGAVTKTLHPATQAATVGALKSGDTLITRFFNGTIDEPRIYTRALTPEEIRTHYLRGKGYGASGAITADKFRIINTSGNKQLELNQTGFDVRNASGQSAFYVDKTTSNVGIGTTSPDKKLKVVGDANISGRLDVGRLNITGVTFSQGDIDAAGSLRVAGGANISGDLGVSGSVGIGTTTPSQKLEVSGNVLVNNTANAFVNLSGPIIRKSGSDIVISD